MGQEFNHDTFQSPIETIEPRSKEDILMSIQQSGNSSMLNNRQVRAAQAKFASRGISKTFKQPRSKSDIQKIRTRSFWSKFLKKLKTTPPTSMDDFLADLATRETPRDQIDARQRDLDARLNKTKIKKSTKRYAEPSKPQLPSFLIGPTPMSRFNQTIKDKKLKEEYREKSRVDLKHITQNNEVYENLLIHVIKEGKATNRIIESFLASSENYKSGLTKGITNINIREAVKIFGEKLEQESFINRVQQGAVHIRKLNATNAFSAAANNNIKPQNVDHLEAQKPSTITLPTLLAV